MDSICVSSSRTLSRLFLLFKAEADAYEKEERGKLAVHLPKVAPFWIHNFIIRVWRGRSVHQLSFSLLLIEEMVTGSQWRAILLPAATGLAWLYSSQPADAPLHGNILPPRALWSGAHTDQSTHTPQRQIIYLSMSTSLEKKNIEDVKFNLARNSVSTWNLVKHTRTLAHKHTAWLGCQSLVEPQSVSLTVLRCWGENRCLPQEINESLPFVLPQYTGFYSSP